MIKMLALYPCFETIWLGKFPYMVVRTPPKNKIPSRSRCKFSPLKWKKVHQAKLECKGGIMNQITPIFWKILKNSNHWILSFMQDTTHCIAQFPSILEFLSHCPTWGTNISLRNLWKSGTGKSGAFKNQPFGIENF